MNAQNISPLPAAMGLPAVASGAKPPFKRMYKHQRGVGLLNMSLALSLAAITVVGALSATKLSQVSDQGRAAGEWLRRVNNGVGQYMVTHYEDLVKLPVHCSQLNLFDPEADPQGQTPPTNSAGCGATLGGVAVANAMQPTFTELSALKLLPPNTQDSLMLPYTPSVYQTGGSPQMAPARLAVLLRHICVPDLPPKNSLPCPSGHGADLESLVFNTQPYVLQSSNLVFGSGAMVGALFRALGGDALIARDAKGELTSVGGNLTVSNPVRRVAQLPADGATVSDQGGVMGIVAARNGYGSSAWAQFTRRDGSTPPTSDWDFADRSLTGVKNLGAQNLTLTQALSVGGGSMLQGTMNVMGASSLHSTLNVGGATTLNGQTTSHGLLTANDGVVVNKNLVANQDVWIHGNAGITGNVGVSGWMGVKGDLSVTEGGFYANKSVKLPYASENTPCNVSHDSVATAAIGEQNALLVCHRNQTSGPDPTGTWRYPRTRMKTPPDVVVVDIDPSKGLCTQRHGHGGQVFAIQATTKACDGFGIQGGIVNLPSDGLWLPVVTQYNPGMVKDPTHAWGRVTGSTHYWLQPYGNSWTVSMLTTSPEQYSAGSTAFLQVVFTKIETY